MTKTTLLIFVLTTLLSCSDKKTIVEKWENGNTKKIIDFESVADSLFKEKKFNEKGDLVAINNYRHSILTGDWTTFENGIKISSGELINGQPNLSKVTWFYKNGNIKIERFYNDKGNLFQEIGYYPDKHVREVLFFDSKVKRNQFKNWYGWFPNGNLQYLHDTLAFPGHNEWDSIGRKIK